MKLMNNDQFLRMMHDTFASLAKLTESKGQEYAADKTDKNQHHNFDKNSEELGITPEMVLQVLLNKHMSSISTYVNRLDPKGGPAPVMSEPMAGRFDDAILYLLLAKGMYLRRHESEAGRQMDEYLGGGTSAPKYPPDRAANDRRDLPWPRP